jgi:sodium pump decarboxylase gamma subunit
LHGLLQEGIIITILGMGVVFFVLVVLMVAINVISKLVGQPRSEIDSVKRVTYQKSGEDISEVVAILGSLQELGIIPSGGRIHIEKI